MKPGTPTLRSFVFLAYGLTWVLLGPWFYVLNVVHQGQVPSWLWALAPLAFLGGWGPSVAALIVTARAGGIAHLTFNTAEAIVFGGLPGLAPDQERKVYLVNVALLVILGLIALGGLAARPTRRVEG